MKTRILLAVAATTALLTSIQAHAQFEFDQFGRPRPTAQLCAQTPNLGPATGRCAYLERLRQRDAARLQGPYPAQPNEPDTATPAGLDEDTAENSTDLFNIYREGLSGLAGHHGFTGDEIVQFRWDKYGFDHVSNLPLWLAMLLDFDEQTRKSLIYVKARADHWKPIAPVSRINFWQKW